MIRLSQQTLKQLPSDVSLPAYQPTDSGVGIVHLGIGAFHRCHMAVYTDDALALAGADWRILGVSLRSQTIADQLCPQDGLYTVVVKASEGDSYRVIASVADVLFAANNPTAVIEAMAAATTRIISLTITEKGYFHDPASGELNETQPQVIHDLQNPDQPETAVGYILAALAKRQATDAGPVCLMSCDNLPSNGRILERIVKRHAALAYPHLLEWIDKQVSFPCTMVDRIVPAMDARDVLAFAGNMGYQDEGVLQTEPFSQWVIEDNFIAGRPAWENVGATLVNDVAPYEETKLRMLNGSHSALAYLGFLSGCTYVHEAMAVDELRSFIDLLMQQELATSLTPPEGMNLDDYREALLDRFENTAMRHKTYQIAMDGSQKIPQRLLATLRFHLENDGPISACSLAIAAWMRYVLALDESGKAFILQDPMAKQLNALAIKAAGNAETLMNSLLGIEAIFGTDLNNNSRFRAELLKWLESLLNDGALKTMHNFIAHT